MDVISIADKRTRVSSKVGVDMREHRARVARIKTYPADTAIAIPAALVHRCGGLPNKVSRLESDGLGVCAGDVLCYLPRL